MEPTFKNEISLLTNSSISQMLVQNIKIRQVGEVQIDQFIQRLSINHDFFSYLGYDYTIIADSHDRWFAKRVS